MAIALQDLQFAYPHGPTILNIPSWTVKPGERVFVHGPSGSGKSTLLKLLAGLLPCQHGQLQVLGQPLQTLSGRQRDRFRARHIGFVFQQLNLIPYLSVLDNVLLGRYFAPPDGNGPDAGQLLAQLGLGEGLYQQAASNLSLGQQQRVAIARALITQPELLIVDEPTSALDADNRDGFMKLLFAQLAEGQTTLLFVSHDQSLNRGFSQSVSLASINHARAPS
ncbi:MAG: ATP-binding cassette domain-containing protein [Cellvibrionaceae bacterium]|nr:ATP-binding cassette domain-containing protein [Cellvibrionaceae bacterium]MCV6625450.1 ATP-binding cassette domain-containing protein [Cellvibrionaceae bacterium]